MSASTLSRRACTAIFCAACAFFPNVPAFAQSLSYMPVDRFGTLLPEVMQPPGQQSETPYGGQESPALRRGWFPMQAMSRPARLSSIPPTPSSI